MLSRRRLFAAAALAAYPAVVPGRGRFKLGVTDWNLRQSGKVDAIALAAKLGFSGVQVSLGRTPGADKLPLDNDQLIASYLEATRREKVALTGTCLDILHVNYLKNDKLGQKWVADSIRITRALKSKVILLPFFGKGALQTTGEMDYVGDVLRELAPEAEKNGVVFGLENTISAENNVRIMERARSKAVSVYYDVGNSTHGGFDILKEIRWLGKARICQIHFKDNPHFLGEGKIDFTAVVKAVKEIGFTEWVVLETDCPTKSVEADMRRNLEFVRRLQGA
jgi:L-ribulose-5-phosphate 3-epimerase